VSEERPLWQKDDTLWQKDDIAAPGRRTATPAR
jgi:hypothetical protein